MASDEQQQQSRSQPNAQLAAEFAALTARVDDLERQLSDLRNPPSTSVEAPHASRPAAPPPPPAASPNRPAKPKASLEDRIGSQLFSRIGIVALLIATALFLKWAIDNQWIGPVARILVGLLAGAAVILWSERFRRRSFPAFAYALKAIGSGALYLSLWAAFQLYHLLPAPAALAAMVLVTAWNAFMAWSQNSELLAAYALFGAFATPLLLSTGGNHEVFLFTYLLVIDIAAVALIRLKARVNLWPRLLLLAFPATAAYFLAWYLGWYHSVSANQQEAVTSLFLALFFFTFLSPSLRATPAGEPATAPDPNHTPDPTQTTQPIAQPTFRVPHSSRSHRDEWALARQRDPKPAYTAILEVVLPLANAAFTALAFYAVLDDAGDHDLLPWVAVLLAAIYLGLTRLPARLQTRVTSAVHLALAVVFLTIAIPLKASGRWIAIGWLAEGTALLWISARLTATEPTQTDQQKSRVPHSSRSHRDEWDLARQRDPSDPTSAFAREADNPPSSLSTLSFQGRKQPTSELRVSHLRIFGRGAPTNVNSPTLLRRLALIALTLGFLGLLLSPLWFYPAVQTAFLNTRFAAALCGILAFALSAATALRASRRQIEEASPTWLTLAAASILALNFTAILAFISELETVFRNPAADPDIDLQKALAISAFLMLYGASLLAAGFWKRSAFLRWQALVLLVFTIAKVFLYDLRNLSQGYRILSFFGLGALLMAISFAYQKDWLALRGPTPETAPPNTDSNKETEADPRPEPGADQ